MNRVDEWIQLPTERDVLSLIPQQRNPRTLQLRASGPPHNVDWYYIYAGRQACAIIGDVRAPEGEEGNCWLMLYYRRVTESEVSRWYKPRPGTPIEKSAYETFEDLEAAIVTFREAHNDDPAIE